MAEPPLRTRFATPADARAVSRFVTALFDTQIARAYDEPGRQTFRAFVTAHAMADRLASGNTGVVLEEGRALVAYGERGGRQIRLMFVREDRQGQGLSRLLLAALLDRLDAAYVTLNASDFALPRYRALGFVPTGPRTEANGIVFTPMRLDRAEGPEDASPHGA